MTNFKLTHSISTHLTLTFATLAFTNGHLSHAEEANTHASSRTASLRVMKIDPHMLPALLPPMSKLVSSPYSDVSAIDNPLGVEQRVSTKSDVMRAVISRQESTSPTTPSLEESFNAESASPKIRLPRASDFMLTSPLSFQVEQPAKLGSIGDGRSLVMTGR